MTDITSGVTMGGATPSVVQAVPPPPAAPAPATPAPSVALDPATTLLTIAQLRQAVLDTAGLTEEDVGALGLVTSYAFASTVNFEVGQYIPGAAPTDMRPGPDGKPVPTPESEQQYIIAIMIGDAADLNDSHVVGDVRVYAIPQLATTPRARAWTIYTLNRALPTSPILTTKLTQDGFIERLADEWAELADLGTEDEGTP